MPRIARESNELRKVGGWCGILGGGAMVLIMVYLGTALFQSNAGPDLQKVMGFVNEHRLEYRFCWSAMIVAAAVLVPLLLALYDSLSERARTPALLGVVSGALGLIFSCLVGAVRASTLPSLSLYYKAAGAPHMVKTFLSMNYFFTERFAFNVDNYMVTGLFVLASLGLGLALRSVARYPKTVVGGLYLVAILGIVGIGEDLLFHSTAFHIKQYDYNVFVAAYSVLLPILAVVMGGRLAAGKNP